MLTQYIFPHLYSIRQELGVNEQLLQLISDWHKNRLGDIIAMKNVHVIHKLDEAR